MCRTLSEILCGMQVVAFHHDVLRPPAIIHKNTSHVLLLQPRVTLRVCSVLSLHHAECGHKWLHLVANTMQGLRRGVILRSNKVPLAKRHTAWYKHRLHFYLFEKPPRKHLICFESLDSCFSWREGRLRLCW